MPPPSLRASLDYRRDAFSVASHVAAAITTAGQTQEAKVCTGFFIRDKRGSSDWFVLSYEFVTYVLSFPSQVIYYPNLRLNNSPAYSPDDDFGLLPFWGVQNAGADMGMDAFSNSSTFFSAFLRRADMSSMCLPFVSSWP